MWTTVRTLGSKRQSLCANYDRWVASPCKTSCYAMRFKCVKHQLICTDLCKRVSCKNDGSKFDVTVNEDSSEDQLWLSTLLIVM